MFDEGGSNAANAMAQRPMAEAGLTRFAQGNIR
jgi:hypothetical protein